VIHVTDTLDADDTTEADDSTDTDSTDPASAPGPLAGDATTYLYWGAFATLLLLALFATLQFYTSASRAISIWVADDFVPVFQAAFNLAVVLACGVGLSLLVRRMRP
jgi:hypothetical protein